MGNNEQKKLTMKEMERKEDESMGRITMADVNRIARYDRDEASIMLHGLNYKGRNKEY
ncbi:MAG TPA: hypothetical protein VJZ93_01265 [Candidatus Nanoarchaeia archaeon]|nr:hypothetical protein [Candidatus Nanoarchaeia archaeon]